MNIAFLRLRPLLKALQGIQYELRRANDIKEFELAHVQNLHVRPPVADTSGVEPESMYTDEQADYFRELKEEMGKIAKLQEPLE